MLLLNSNSESPGNAGLGRKFGQLDAAHIRIGDVGEDRLGSAGVGITDRGASRPESRDGVFHVLDVQSIVGETLRPLLVRLLEFEETVLADVQVNQPRLPLVVVETERFAVSHFLGVVGYRLRDVRHVDGDVIHPHDVTIGVLRHPHTYGQPRQKSGREQHWSTHCTFLR